MITSYNQFISSGINNSIAIITAVEIRIISIHNYGCQAYATIVCGKY